MTTKPTIRVRPFRAEDGDQVRRLFVDNVGIVDDSETARKLWPEYIRKSLETDLRDIAAWYQAPGGNFWVATATSEDPAVSEKVVGIVALQLTSASPKHGEIRRVFIDRKYHRLGIGSKLMDALESWTKLNGFERLELATNADNTRSIGFYLALGYSRDSDNGETFWDEPKYMPLAFFSKKL